MAIGTALTNAYVHISCAMQACELFAWRDRPQGAPDPRRRRAPRRPAPSERRAARPPALGRSRPMQGVEPNRKGTCCPLCRRGTHPRHARFAHSGELHNIWGQSTFNNPLRIRQACRKTDGFRRWSTRSRMYSNLFDSVPPLHKPPPAALPSDQDSAPTRLPARRPASWHAATPP